MANNSVPKVYCDACFFIALFKKEAGRYEICKAILEDAEAGKVEIYVSTAVILECCHPPDGKTFEDDDTDDFFDNWYFIKIDVDRILAKAGRKVFQRLKANKHKVKPFDSLHIAAAIQEGCSHLFTYDREHLLKADLAGVLPEIKICEPERFWGSSWTQIALFGSPGGRDIDLDLDE